MPVRPAITADITAMHAIRMGVRENRLADPSRVTISDYHRLMEGHGRAWVYESGEEVVGFGVVDLLEQSIWALFVAPHAEGNGVGSALLKAMVDSAFASGIGALWLSRNHSRTSLRALLFTTGCG